MAIVWKHNREQGFFEALKEQRWDDHRFYHHNRINQTLHFFSACSFLGAVAMLASGHASVAALVGWTIGMCSRQIGHFFFEPRDYDEVNQVTDEYKERVKVGYNIRRKVVLMSVWAVSPLLLLASPTLLGLLQPHTDFRSFVDHAAILWLWVGVFAVLFRTVHLFFLRDVQTGIVWMTKILTDPLHDIYLYHRAPLAVLRGELNDSTSDGGRGAQRV